MEEKKISKLHYWIRQLRHMICFVVVLLVVVFYSFDSFAAISTSSSDTIQNYFSIDASNDMPILYYDNIALYYGQDGGSMSNVQGLWQGFYCMNANNVSYMTGVWNNFVDTVSIPMDITKDGITYDLSSACWMFFPWDTWDNRMYAVPIIATGSLAIVNGYLVSDAPFTFFRLYYMSGAWEWGNRDVYLVTGTSDNGYYCYDMSTFYNAEAAGGFFFTDLPVYAGSSDGSTGFQTFTLSSTDFDFSNNYDFNFLRTNDFIVSVGQPNNSGSGINTGESDAYHYLNFNMNNSYTSQHFDKFYHIMKFQYNQNMILHPEWYQVKSEAYFTYKDSSMQNAVRLDYPATSSMTLQDLGLLYGNGGSAPEVAYQYYESSRFTDSNNKSLTSYFLDSIHSLTNANIQYIDTSSYIHQLTDAVSNVFGYSFEGFGVPRTTYEIIPEFGSTIEIAELTCNVWIEQVSNGDYRSGVNTSGYDWLTGKVSITSNDNNVNLYPVDPSSGLPSSVIQGQGSGTGVTYGGSNNAYAQGGQGGNSIVTINPPNEPYILSMGEYGDMADIFTGIRDAFQSVGGGGSNRRTAGADESNGGNDFITVIGNTFEFLPSQLWQIMTISISIVSGVAVVKFVRNRR